MAEIMVKHTVPDGEWCKKGFIICSLLMQCPFESDRYFRLNSNVKKLPECLASTIPTVKKDGE